MLPSSCGGAEALLLLFQCACRKLFWSFHGKCKKKIKPSPWGNFTFLRLILQLKGRTEDILVKGSITTYFTNGEKEQHLLKIIMIQVWKQHWRMLGSDFS